MSNKLLPMFEKFANIRQRGAGRKPVLGAHGDAARRAPAELLDARERLALRVLEGVPLLHRELELLHLDLRVARLLGVPRGLGIWGGPALPPCGCTAGGI